MLIYVGVYGSPILTKRNVLLVYKTKKIGWLKEISKKSRQHFKYDTLINVNAGFEEA
jgi:hypothetical protein